MIVLITIAPSIDDTLSIFDILNIFWRRWFLSRQHLVDSVLSAQKNEDGTHSWVEFSSQFHSHLVKCAVVLMLHCVCMVKRVMFVYVVELLDGASHMAFFKLQKGGRKANNAQKEKWRLAQKHSCAAKQERDREAAKAAKLPPCEQQCKACGRKFKSHKVARKHKCQHHSKVVRVPEVTLVLKEESCPPFPDDDAMSEDVPLASLILSSAPPAPTHSTSMPLVTASLRVKPGPSRSQLYPAFKHLADQVVVVVSAKQKVQFVENKEYSFLSRISLIEADSYARSFHSFVVNLLVSEGDP